MVLELSPGPLEWALARVPAGWTIRDAATGRTSQPFEWTTWQAVAGTDVSGQDEVPFPLVYSGSGAIAKNKPARDRKIWQRAARALASGREAKVLHVGCETITLHGSPVVAAKTITEKHPDPVP